MAATAEILFLWPLSGRMAFVAPSSHLGTTFCHSMAERAAQRRAVIRISPHIGDLLRLRRHVGKTLEHANLDITY